ncbi:MAG: DNA repair protein RecO [candidate division Zixibacteria bacterium]
MSRFKIEAFVIRATRMAESSRVVTLFSKEVGKVKAVAKGVGKLKSKMSGVIELFNRIEGVLYKKETSELGTLGSAAVLDEYSRLTSDPRKFGFGSAWCEVLDKTSHPEHPRPKTYSLTGELLAALVSCESSNTGLVFWSGMVKLLGIEGYAPRLDNCLACGKNELGKTISISLARGGAVCNRCTDDDEYVVGISSDGLVLLRQMENMPLLEISKSDYGRKAGKEAAEVIISFGSYHLGLPRHLKSFKFLESLAD